MNTGAFGMDRAVRGAYSPDQRDIFRSRWNFNRDRSPTAKGKEAVSPILTFLLEPSVAKRIGSSFLLESRFLAREADPVLRNYGLLTLGRRLQQAGHLAEALEVFTSLQNPDVSSDIRTEAQTSAQALRGRGSLGGRAESLLSSLVHESLSPTSLAAMGLGSLAFQWGRYRALNSLLTADSASWLTRGWGARGISALAGMAFEVPAYSWLGGGGLSEWPASALMLGALRLGGKLRGNLGAFGGLWLGKQLTSFVGGKGDQVFSDTLVDSLVAFLHFHIANRVTNSLWGARLKSLEWQVESNLPTAVRFSFQGRVRNPVAVSVSKSIPVQESLTPQKPGILLMEMPGETKALFGLRRIKGSPVFSLEDFPEIHRIMLPQVRDLLIKDPRLVPLLQAHEENLSKLNDTLERSDFPGAAPFAARLLADQLLPCLSDDLLLSDHPVARLVSMSLEAHYQAIGDHVGAQIYRDLNTVYDWLSSGRSYFPLR